MTVTLDADQYAEAVEAQARELADYALNKRLRIQRDRPTDPARVRSLQDRLEALLGVPVGLAAAVAAGEYGPLSDIERLIMRGYRTFDYEQRPLARKLDQELQDLVEAVTSEVLTKSADWDSVWAEYGGMSSDIVARTRAQGEAVVGALTAAVARCPNWTTPRVVAEPAFNKENWMEPPGAYHVQLGKGTYAPSFTLFVTEDGGIQEVEDVLEGGDEDFFTSPEAQYDYFNLVNELRKPGSTSRGKRLTLYTARPLKDRERYEYAKTLPLNVFLASTFNEAYGLARDLGGGTVRDVWRVVVDSTHLVQTLDAGSVRHYQTVGSGPVPIRSIELVAPGDE